MIYDLYILEKPIGFNYYICHQVIIFVIKLLF
jgi:hypothetical protein